MSEPKMINSPYKAMAATGAFTWGVLDRLLEDDRIQIEGISGTSAGALNGVVVADGLDREGKEGARKALRRFWRGVSICGYHSLPLQRTLLDRLLWTLDTGLVTWLYHILI